MKEQLHVPEKPVDCSMSTLEEEIMDINDIVELKRRIRGMIKETNQESTSNVLQTIFKLKISTFSF